MKSGHPWSFNQVVDGQPSAFPFTEIKNLPEGYSWSDISYIICGDYWKALFVDTQGYIITDKPGQSGNSEYLNQWNFANDLIGMNANWVGFQSGQAKLLYTCGECHTTGYTARGTQDGLPGLIGTWAEAGVRCEACHAPGSMHITDPQNIEMEITPTSDLCADCHNNADLEMVDELEPGGTPEHLSEKIFRGKHMVLDCVDCHDPHNGVVQARKAKQETTRIQCAECHFEEAKYQSIATYLMLNLACTECHMPLLVKAAWGDPAKFSGDIHSHNMAIDPSRFDQFVTTQDTESYVLAPTGLNYACRRCHGGGRAIDKTDEELRAGAASYHEKLP